MVERGGGVKAFVARLLRFIKSSVLKIYVSIYNVHIPPLL